MHYGAPSNLRVRDTTKEPLVGRSADERARKNVRAIGRSAILVAQRSGTLTSAKSILEGFRMNVVSFLRDTKGIGELSELIVATALARAGYLIAAPIGENARYDLIIDKDEKLSRVRVKTGRLRNGALLFNCYSVHSHRRGRLRTYRGSIEFFGVYCPDVEGAFLVPVDDVPRSCNGSLRWLPSRNGQHSKVRWAHKYLISTVAVPGPFVGAEAGNGVTQCDAKVPS
jgi:hypothetical protein